MDDKLILRARDFWTAILLFLGSIFFLIQTTDIPFFETSSAGVDSAEWYNSAALVPYGIFGLLLVLSLVLLAVSIVDGGAKVAFSSIGLGTDRAELFRLFCLSLILFFYIFGLVPRVDFIIGSALLVTALIWGFHSGSCHAMAISTVAMALAGLYALVFNFGSEHWAKPHDDDWVTLSMFILLTTYMFVRCSVGNTLDRVVKCTPVIAVLCPLILVLAMAFGFRQNVPNRTGLLFQKIEYHYYVTVKPYLQGK